jgi:hydroxymethylpyrimidine pyrophosphatase-like HAD family hydrolase
MENFNLKKYLAENKLIKEEIDFKAMSDDLASKEMVRQELMDMRVSILRIMKSLKNYGYSKEEVLAFFDNERDNKIKNTFF